MKLWLKCKCFQIKSSLNKVLTDESGEANIIAIILIILVVIALVVIFRDELTGIVTDLLVRIREELEW